MKKHLSANSRLLKAAMLSCMTILTSTLFFAQPGNHKNYATSQTNTVVGVCLDCEIQNPQNALGSNENDYSMLKAGIGALTRVEQTLKLPSLSLNKLTIGLGTGNGQLTISLLHGVSIETFNGNTSNQDMKFVDSNILKIDAQTNKAMVELRPTKPYDKVKISLHTGIASINSELRIYYAHQSEYVTLCNTSLPANPSYYYPFDLHLHDMVQQYDLNTTNPSVDAQFQDETIICEQSLKTYNELTTAATTKNKLEKTISFWADVEESLSLNVFGTEIKLDKTAFRVKQAHGYTKNPDDDDDAIFPLTQKTDKNSSTGLHHYSIKLVPTFRTADGIQLCQILGGTAENCAKSTGGIVTTYVDGNPSPNKYQFEFIAPDYYNPVQESDKIITLTTTLAKIDDLTIYDEALPDEVLKKIPSAYNIPTTTSPTFTTQITAEDLFTISPNPTSGQITLEGNLSFEDSDIFINNTFGKEVFRSKLKTKTFDLPSILPGGIYMVTVQTKDRKTFTRKIILTR